MCFGSLAPFFKPWVDSFKMLGNQLIITNLYLLIYYLDCCGSVLVHPISWLVFHIRSIVSSKGWQKFFLWHSGLNERLMSLITSLSKTPVHGEADEMVHGFGRIRTPKRRCLRIRTPRVKWSFMLATLKGMCFSTHFWKIIHNCIASTFFSVLSKKKFLFQSW